MKSSEFWAICTSTRFSFRLIFSQVFNKRHVSCGLVNARGKTSAPSAGLRCRICISQQLSYSVVSRWVNHASPSPSGARRVPRTALIIVYLRDDPVNPLQSEWSLKNIKGMSRRDASMLLIRTVMKRHHWTTQKVRRCRRSSCIGQYTMKFEPKRERLS
jgi:hypothetical protein